MSTNKLFRILLLLAVLTAGVWLLGRPGVLQPEGLARQQALIGALGPVGVQGGDGVSSAAGDIIVHEPVAPVVVNLADVPQGEGDGNSQYERWVRGEIDLDEDDSIVSAEEKAILQEAALDLPAASSVQQMRSGPGLAAPTVGTHFDSLDMNDCCGGGANVPPDPELAAGPDHLIAVVNVAFEIYDKSGTSLVGPTTFSSFFSSLGGTNCTAGGPFDPNVLYDESEDRFMLAVDGDGNAYCMGISQTGDPTGSWYLYEFPTNVGGNFFDYPHAGIGRDAIYMGANMFSGGFAEARVWAFNKAELYAGLPTAPVSRSTGFDDTPQPVNLHGYNQGTWPTSGPHYILTDRNFNGQTYALHTWNDPFGANTFATVNVFNLPAVHGVAVGFPVDVVQSGGGTIQANDFRPLDFEYRNGSGWTAMTVACNPGGGTVDCIQWAEIDLANATLVQTGVFASNGDYRFFPDVAANHCNDMAVGYTKSSGSIFPAVWATGRESGDALGTLQAEVQLKVGEVNYTAFDGAPRRWGDYSGMTIDPDGQTFWYLGEYSKITGSAFGNWGNYISALSYPGCNAPVATPNIEVDPSDLQVTQVEGTVVTYTLTISNTGGADLDWVIEEGASMRPEQIGNGPSTQLSVDDFTPLLDPDFECDAYENYVGREPAGHAVNCTDFLARLEALQASPTPLAPTDLGFAHDIGFVSDNVVEFTLNNFPGQQVLSSNTQSIFGYDYNRTGSTLYALNDGTKQFGTFDRFSGTFTSIGASTPETGHTWTGLTVDPRNDMIYASSTNGTTSTLYTINSSTGAATVVGPVTGLGLLIEIAMNADGELYGHDIGTDSIYAINPSTGAPTLVGLTGYNANFAQGMDFDSDDGTLYIFLYTGGGANVFGTVNLTTGAVTPLAQDNPLGEFEGAMLTNNCAQNGDISWVSLSPTSGTNAPGTSTQISVTFDATGLTPDVYTGTLCINSNDPGTPLVEVPLEMTVDPLVVGVDLAPDQADSGLVGETVTYTLQITNTGNLADTFDLSVSGNSWTTTFSQSSISLAAGASTTVEAYVDVPSGASDGDMDTATVTATSQSDPGESDSVMLTTTADIGTTYIYLPVVFRR